MIHRWVRSMENTFHPRPLSLLLRHLLSTKVADPPVTLDELLKRDCLVLPVPDSLSADLRHCRYVGVDVLLIASEEYSPRAIFGVPSPVLCKLLVACRCVKQSRFRQLPLH